MLAVEITPRALAQIERAALWWAENRAAAPGAIRLDLWEALEVLAQQAGIGARCTSRHYADIRRLYLARTRYHVYYRVTGDKLAASCSCVLARKPRRRTRALRGNGPDSWMNGKVLEHGPFYPLLPFFLQLERSAPLTLTFLSTGAAHMGYKEEFLAELIRSDRTGLLPRLHERLTANRLKYRASSNSETLLYYVLDNEKRQVGLAAFRVPGITIFSFPKTYWLCHFREVDAALSDVPQSSIVETDGPVSSSQSSMRQVIVSSRTQEMLLCAIDGPITRHARLIES